LILRNERSGGKAERNGDCCDFPGSIHICFPLLIRVILIDDPALASHPWPRCFIIFTPSACSSEP
jgi:hypothetical protein